MWECVWEIQTCFMQCWGATRPEFGEAGGVFFQDQMGGRNISTDPYYGDHL